MTVVEKIDEMIALLNATKEDATKVDGGKTGTPGTRVRKVAQDLKRNCDEIRKAVLDAREAAAAAAAK